DAPPPGRRAPPSPLRTRDPRCTRRARDRGRSEVPRSPRLRPRRRGSLRSLRNPNCRLLRGRFGGCGAALELGRDLQVVELRGVEPEDLPLAIGSQPRVIGIGVVGVVPGSETLDLPLRFPDGVVTAEEHLVLAQPEQQLAHDLRKEARPGVHKAADHHRQPRVDIALLGRHEAEVLDARQADMLDDEVQSLEPRRHLVDVRHVEGVLVQRPNRGALVDVDVLDAEFLALLQEPPGLGVLEGPAARTLAPFGGVELASLASVLADILGELLESGIALTRIPASVNEELPGMLQTEVAVGFGRIEAGLIPLLEICGLEYCDVHIAVLEHVFHEVVFGVLLEMLESPMGICWTETLVGVEALDPPFRVLLL